MANDVLNHLAIAKHFLFHANFAGTSRQGIADAFSSIDAMFSALLCAENIKPPRNHKQKLDLVRKNLPSVFSARTEKHGLGLAYLPGVEWSRLEGFYKEWLAARYDDFCICSDEFVERINEAKAVLAGGMRHISLKLDMDYDDIEKKASKIAFGYESSAVNYQVGMAHEKLFHQAELYGEIHGWKLGIKLAATTNYCDLDFVAGDKLTQGILESDAELASEAAEIYLKFNEMIKKIIEKRRALLESAIKIPDMENESLNKSTDFILSLKARYHGATVDQQGRRFSIMLSKLLGSMGSEGKK